MSKLEFRLSNLSAQLHFNNKYNRNILPNRDTRIKSNYPQTSRVFNFQCFKRHSLTHRYP